jgi:zinc protease
MIRRTAIALFLALPAAWAADEALPKAETILDRYVEVTGGKAAYEKHKTELGTGTMTFTAQGLKGSISRYAAAPNQAYAVIELEGIGKIEQGTSGDVAWEKSAIMGPRVKSGEEKTQALRESIFNEPIRWRETFLKAETVGRETVEGEDCYKVVLTPKEGKPETSYYSKKSGLIVKSEIMAVTQMGEMNVEMVVSAYKEFDGVKVPTRMLQRAAGQEFVIAIDNVKYNESLPADRFEPPTEIKALLNKPAEKK